ncbi:MAG: NAD(P)-dependent oxidoreductase [Pseudomonadota bacterium]
MDRIGFIGLGAMGHGMADNILTKHGALTLLGNRNRAPVDDLVAKGAVEAATPAALAEACDVILFCLPNSDVVERVIADMGKALSPGKTLIDTGTSSRESTLKLHKSLVSRGVHFAESPLTGGTLQAKNAELGALVGADIDVFERIEPILTMVCATVQRFGPVGSGAAAKFVNNYMVMGIAAVVCEAFHVARLTGSDWGKLYDVVIRGSADSGVFRRIIGNAKDGDFEGYVFSVENALKDMNYISEMNDTLGRNTALNRAIHTFFEDAINQGHGPKLLSELMRPDIGETLFKRQDDQA